MLSFPGISLGWVTNIQQDGKVQHTACTDHPLTPWRPQVLTVKQFPVSYLSCFLFKVIIAWFQTHYCLVKFDILFKAKANYISENSEKMARKTPWVYRRCETSPFWGQKDLFMRTGTCSGYLWPGQLHLWPSPPASHIQLICECIYLRAWLWFWSFQK